jgi:hypothetical protein
MAMAGGRAVGRTPDFIGVGAQRAGTTWLYACLYDHPAICAPIKEIHFFSQERHWTRGFEWYESLFRRCPPAATVGEFSTSYLASPVAAERIRSRYPRVRLLISLRSPIARVYSHYRHEIDGSRYATHLERYLSRFPRDQLLVLVYEDSVRDPHGFVAQVFRFLGVDAAHEPQSVGARINASRLPRFPRLDRTLSAVSRALRNRGLHGLWWFTRGLGLGNRIRLGNWLRSANVQAAAPGLASGPDDDTRERLWESLAADVRWVERFLGRDLPEWMQDYSDNARCVCSD